MAIVLTVVVVIKEERLEAFCEVLRMCVHKDSQNNNLNSRIVHRRGSLDLLRIEAPESE